MDAAILGVIGTLLGTILGWRLSHRTAREVAREERQWQEQQTIRQREDVAVEGLRAAVIEVQALMPDGVVSRDEGREPLSDAHARLRQAWTQASLLRDDAVDRCFYAVDMAFFIGGQDLGRLGSEGTINVWPLSAGIIQLRKALDAFLRRDPIPELQFPTSEEQVQLVREHRFGLEAITDWMMERNFTSFR